MLDFVQEKLACQVGSLLHGWSGGLVWEKDAKSEILQCQNVLLLQMQSEEDKKKSESSKMRVRVAIRIRPMSNREQAKEQSNCITGYPGNRLIIGSDREFRFDSVFTKDTAQERVYRQCVHDLVIGCFDGYNAAVLAYGQTGSGKTYTMGTANVGVSQEEMGIIPRVIRDLFTEMDKRRTKVDFVIKASFLEIYNQQIIDLLGNDYLLRDPNDRISNTAAIRQEKDGSISIYGICEEKVQTSQQMFSLLERGATHRSTASTLMNDSSSRSHAIFTVFIEQHVIQDLYKENPAEVQEGFVTAKFHFVDLAGSERIKKTGATGSTLREGININLGLLCLGNVISALTDPDKKGNQRFVPYRDSKLTRILQDSLGGNSNTYMIACVSPAESNYEESLSTLKYAARAMNIKNTPIVNRDPQSALISQLKQKLFEAEVENKKMRALLSQSGVVDEELLAQMTAKHKDAFQQTNKAEAEQLKRAILELQQRITVLNEELSQEKKKAASHQLEVLETKRDKDMLRLQIDDIIKNNPDLKASIVNEQQMSVLQAQLQTIQSMKKQITQKDSQFGQLQNEFEKVLQSAKRDQQILVAKTKEVYELKKEIIDLHKRKREIPDLPQNTGRMSFIQPQSTSRVNESLRMSFQQSMIPRSQTVFEDTFHNGTQLLSASTQREFFQDPSHLANDQTFIQQSTQFEQFNQNCNAQIKTMSCQIKQRQKLLKQITTTQIDLEYQLINSMKQEYHKKIVGLEREKDKLQRELASVSKNKDEKILTMVEKDKTVLALKQKKEELEVQLKEFRKKQKQQHALEKIVQDQKTKIADMNKQIKSFKLQKLELTKKMKEDKDKFEKFKTQRYKQLMLVKKSNIQKDNQVKRLTKETVKTQQIFVKKEQQTRQLKKLNETLRQIYEPKSIKNSKRATVSIAATTHQINYEHIVLKTIERMELDIERQIQHEKYTEELKNIEVQIDQFLNKDCKFKIQLERLLMSEKIAQTQIEQAQLADQIKDLQGKINETQMVVQSLEDKYAFTKTKLAQIFTAEIPKMDIDMEIIYNKAYDTIQTLRRLFRTFLQRLMIILIELNRNKKTINQLNQQVSSLTEKQSQMDEHIIRTNIQHQEALAQLRQQLLMITSYIDEQPQPSIITFPSANCLQVPTLTLPAATLNTPRKSTQEKNEKRYFERQIQDLNKKVKQLILERDQYRRKYQLLNSKYENVKKLGTKDKFIGLTEEVKLSTLKEKRMQRTSITPVHNSTIAHINSSSMLLDEVSDMWSGLNTTSSVSNLSRFKVHSNEERRVQTEYEQVKEELNKWECIGVLEGHNNPILGLACFSGCLISTSMKNLKLWDLESQKVISDLSGQHLNGLVKVVVIDPDKRLMVTACDRNIAVWDFLNMKVVQTFKGHKDEIRSMYLSDGLLFSGGKGTGNTPSLLTWDFRSNNPIDEKQRNQDIFSITSYRNTLYYGTRNHQIRRVNLQNMEAMAPLENPHFDAVTGLVTLNSYLISGSKDKNLKLWNLESAANNYRYTSYGHNDYINCVIRDKLLSVFYSGSKDGYMKAGIVSKDKIQVIGSMNCHTQSINALCSFEQNDNICGFVSGSSDKTIKLWQASPETMENIQSQILDENT